MLRTRTSSGSFHEHSTDDQVSGDRTGAQAKEGDLAAELGCSSYRGADLAVWVKGLNGLGIIRGGQELIRMAFEPIGDKAGPLVRR